MRFLQEERGNQPGTIAAYCQVLTRGLKYLASKGEDAAEGLEYLKGLTTRYQRQAETGKSASNSWQRLSQNKKWLHWEEVLEVLKLQRAVYEVQHTPVAKASESQKYLALLLYCVVPPARAEEYRTLKIRHGTRPGTKITKENVLHFGTTMVLELAEFKTSKSVGVQTIDISEYEFLTSHLDAFITRERASLLKGDTDHGFLFMVRKITLCVECGCNRHAHFAYTGRKG